MGAAGRPAPDRIGAGASAGPSVGPDDPLEEGVELLLAHGGLGVLVDCHALDDEGLPVVGDNGAALGQVTAAVGDGAGALVGLGGLAVDARLPRDSEGADTQ